MTMRRARGAESDRSVTITPNRYEDEHPLPPAASTAGPVKWIDVDADLATEPFQADSLLIVSGQLTAGDGNGGSRVPENGNWNRRIATPVFNVRDFGAIPNTLEAAATNVQAIGAAISAAAALRVAGKGGGTVYLPAGSYWTNDPLWLESGVRLLGDGSGRTTIVRDPVWLAGAFAGGCDPEGPYGHAIVVGKFQCEWVEDVTIEGLTINASARGIGAKQARRFTIRDVVVHGSARYGIALEYYNPPEAENDPITPEMCTDGNCPAHPAPEYYEPCEDVLFENVVAHSNHFDGIDIKRARNITLRNVTAFGNGGYGIDVRGEYMVLDGILTHSNRRSGLSLSCHSNRDHPTRAVVRNVVSHSNGWTDGIAGSTLYAWEGDVCGDENVRDGITVFASGFRIDITDPNGCGTPLYSVDPVSPSQISFDSVVARGNAGHGIGVALCFEQRVAMTGVVSVGNGKCGLAITGPDNHIAVAGCVFNGNGNSGVALLNPGPPRPIFRVDHLPLASTFCMSGTQACDNSHHGLFVELRGLDPEPPVTGDSTILGYDVTVTGSSFHDNGVNGVDVFCFDLTLSGCTMMRNGGKGFKNHALDSRHLLTYCRAAGNLTGGQFNAPAGTLAVYADLMDW